MTNVISLETRQRSNALNDLEIRNVSTERENDTELSQRYTQYKVTDSAYFFTPVKAPLFADFNGQRVEVENKRAIIKQETGELVSVVGKNYGIVSNSEVFGQFDEALAESGIDLTGAYKRVTECSGGAQTILGYSFPAYSVEVTNRCRGDVVRLAVTARNSYDGTTPFTARFTQDRLVCKNSMVSCTDISYYHGRHTKNLVIEHAVQTIKESIHMFLENAETYKLWADTPVRDRDARKMFERLCVKQGYKSEFNEKAVEEHFNQWLKESAVLGKNRWALFNTLTFWSTHAKVTAKSEAQNNQRLLQIKREEKVLALINSAGWFKKAA